MKKFLFLLLIISSVSFAAEDFYQFKNPVQQQRFALLTNELRCLVCQNQNIAESNSSLAGDLREQIYQQILDNKSNTDIINYLVARYGNYILYRPPFSGYTLALWLGPFLLLLSGLGFLLYYIRGAK